MHALQRNAEVSEKVCVNIIYLSCCGILGDCGYSVWGRDNFVALFLEGIIMVFRILFSPSIMTSQMIVLCRKIFNLDQYN